MKKLFTFMSLMAFTMAMNAQDPSKWQEGQDVAAEIGLKELVEGFSGTLGKFDYGHYAIESIGNVWKGATPNEYLPREGDRPAVLGFYNTGQNFEFYQIVKVPAGSYTLKANAFYREGSVGDSFKNRWKNQKQKNGHMFANILADDQTTVTYYNDLVLKSLADVDNFERIYTNTGQNTAWMSDEENKHSENGELKSYFAPCCCEGFGLYFAANHYVNEKKFILTQDSYVKIGFSKTASIPEDCVDFGNIQVIYNGAVTDEDLHDLAVDEFDVASKEMGDLVGTFDEAGFEALADILDGLREKLEAQASEATTEQLATLKEQCYNYIDKYKSAKEVVLHLGDVLDVCNLLLNTTEYPGLDAFKSAVDAQKAALDEKDPDKVGDPTEYYNNILNNLSVAHATYLDSQILSDDHPKDFTSLVKSPWFVNTEFTPVNEGDADGQYWHLTEESWANLAWDNEHQNQDTYTNKMNKFGLTDIASKVNISSDKTVTGEWFKYQDYTNGWNKNSELCHEGRLIGFSTGWASTFSNTDGRPGISGIAQRLVGLPKGYYTVSCLVRGNRGTDDWADKTPFLGCFAENSNEVRVSSRVSENLNGWSKWESTPEYWDNVETQVIAVNDGKLLIGGGGYIGNIVTGFRLWFYGESPNFSALAQERVDELRPLISEDYFTGDQKKLNDLLNSVKFPIADAAAYDEALATFREFTSYQEAVVNKMKEYNAKVVINTIADEWASPAYRYLTSVAGLAETDTYEKVDEYNALANAYKILGEWYAKAGEVEGDDALKETVKKQQKDLVTRCATIAEVERYTGDVGTHIHLHDMKALNCETATGEKPVDVSSLIVNAKFDQLVGSDGKTDVETGWNSTVGAASQNEYARYNAELWNRAAFTFSQKLYGLPAGEYVLRVHALYRDGSACTYDGMKAYQKAGSDEAWEKHNAVLFMKTSDENKVETYVRSIYAWESTVRSFDWVANGREVFDEGIKDTKIMAIDGTIKDADKKDGVTYESKNDGDYPFDTRVETKKLDAEGNVVKDEKGNDVIEKVNYFPASMYGFYSVCQKYPEVYKHEIKITIKDGDIIELGFRKDKAEGGDWVIFDAFELEYLSGESFARAFTGVENIVVDAKENGAIFNMAGQRVGKDFKGIVIKNGVKVLNK